MNRLHTKTLNIPQTVLSGQTHAWRWDGEKYIGEFIEKILILKEKNKDWYWQTYPQKDDIEFFNNYFGLKDIDDSSYKNRLKNISIDEHTKDATKKYFGLRVLNQELNQTLFSFILAQHKNIKAIRRSLDFIKKDYNKIIKTDVGQYYLFPNLDYFYNVDDSILKKAGVGYRLRYLKDAAKKIVDGEVKIKQDSSFDEKKLELTKIFGIGDKIADCVLSFSLNANHITPIDIWSERIIKNLYKNYASKSYLQKSTWFSKKFGDNTSLAGQFLFEYVRNFDFENYK